MSADWSTGYVNRIGNDAWSPELGLLLHDPELPWRACGDSCRMTVVEDAPFHGRPDDVSNAPFDAVPCERFPTMQLKAIEGVPLYWSAALSPNSTSSGSLSKASTNVWPSLEEACRGRHMEKVILQSCFNGVWWFARGAGFAHARCWSSKRDQLAGVDGRIIDLEG
jgi:hypothetical protein